VGKYTKWTLNYKKVIHVPNDRNILQMAINNTYIFHFKALNNLPIFGLKIYHLATWIWSPFCETVSAEIHG
jgi:hypothetical protein